METLYKDITLGKFKSEKEIENYLLKDIKSIWLKVFDEIVIHAEQQKYIPYITHTKQNKPLLVRGPRIDLYVECKSGNNYIVEIKNPKLGSIDTLKAIGQVLYYSTLFKKANKLVIISTVFENGFKEVIARYKLPIEFILIADREIFLLK